jgi:hypothetical protein
MKDSTPNTDVLGQGLYCQCFGLNITNSTFRNLTATAGGALYLYSEIGSQFDVWNTTFD